MSSFILSVQRFTHHLKNRKTTSIHLSKTTSPDLLCDVPQVSVTAESEHTVVDGHLVEVGSLFVAEESVRDPDLGPAVIPHTDLF